MSKIKLSEAQRSYTLRLRGGDSLIRNHQYKYWRWKGDGYADGRTAESLLNRGLIEMAVYESPVSVFRLTELGREIQL